jgi:hypothetical protein
MPLGRCERCDFYAAVIRLAEQNVCPQCYMSAVEAGESLHRPVRTNEASPVVERGTFSRT